MPHGVEFRCTTNGLHFIVLYTKNAKNKYKEKRMDQSNVEMITKLVLEALNKKVEKGYSVGESTY